MFDNDGRYPSTLAGEGRQSRRVCGASQRRAELWLREFAARCPGHAHLTAVEPRLRCRRCGNRAGNNVYVTIADRE